MQLNLPGIIHTGWHKILLVGVYPDKMTAALALNLTKKVPDFSVLPQIISRPEFLIKIYAQSDFAEFIIKENVVLDEQVVTESKRIFEETGPGKKYFLLVSSQGFIKVTKKARMLGADAAFSRHLAAVSCYTSNVSLALLGELYNKINKPAVITKVFSRRETALEWLFEQIALQSAAKSNG